MLNPPPLPMAVCQLQSFSFYSSGVYYDKNCGNKPEDLDHAVLAVGYGTDVRNLPRGTSCLFTCLLTYCLSCCSPQPPPPFFFCLFCFACSQLVATTGSSRTPGPRTMATTAMSSCRARTTTAALPLMPTSPLSKRGAAVISRCTHTTARVRCSCVSSSLSYAWCLLVVHDCCLH